MVNEIAYIAGPGGKVKPAKAGAHRRLPYRDPGRDLNSEMVRAKSRIYLTAVPILGKLERRTTKNFEFETGPRLREGETCAASIAHRRLPTHSVI